MDRGTWQATVHGVAKESDTTGRLSLFHLLFQALIDSPLLAVNRSAKTLGDIT